MENEGAVGGLYFGLYNDNTYQICATGGLGETCHEGNYLLKEDTLVLLNLEESYTLQSHRFLIEHFEVKNREGNSGEVFQLDKMNKKMTGKSDIRFVVRMDQLELNNTSK